MISKSIDFTGLNVSERKIIRPPEFPGHDRPYSPGVLVENTLYCSGKGDIDAQGIRPPTFDAQVRLTMKNVGDILRAAGFDFKNVIWTNIYLSDYNKYEQANKIFSEYFEPGQAPARAQDRGRARQDLESGTLTLWNSKRENDIHRCLCRKRAV